MSKTQPHSIFLCVFPLILPLCITFDPSLSLSIFTSHSVSSNVYTIRLCVSIWRSLSALEILSLASLLIYFLIFFGIAFFFAFNFGSSHSILSFFFFFSWLFFSFIFIFLVFFLFDCAISCAKTIFCVLWIARLSTFTSCPFFFFSSLYMYFQMKNIVLLVHGAMR